MVLWHTDRKVPAVSQKWKLTQFRCNGHQTDMDNGHRWLGSLHMVGVARGLSGSRLQPPSCYCLNLFFTWKKVNLGKSSEMTF